LPNGNGFFAKKRLSGPDARRKKNPMNPCKSVEKVFSLPEARNHRGNLERKRTLSIPLLRGKTPLLWE